MDALREFWLDARRNALLLIGKCAVLSVIALCVYTLVAFSTSSEGAVRQSFERQAEYDLLSLADAFMTDPEGFYEFRQNGEGLQALSRFDDLLTSSTSFGFLSLFDQPVPVLEFKGGPEFGASYGRGAMSDVTDMNGELAFNAKAMQINKQAYDFYGIEVSKGNGIAWSDVDYRGMRIPVLLGAAYESVYLPGDVLAGSFYGRNATFEVKGILERGSTVAYLGDPAYALDYSIVIPYPASFDGFATVGDGFDGILLFAYVNGEVAVKRGTETSKVLDELDSISRQSGFESYEMVGLYDYSTMYSHVRRLISENLDLSKRIVALVALLGFGVIVSFDWALASRRTRRGEVALLLGESLDWRRTLALISVVWWGLSAALSICLVWALPYHNIVAGMTLAPVLLVECVLDLACGVFFARRGQHD